MIFEHAPKPPPQHTTHSTIQYLVYPTSISQAKGLDWLVSLRGAETHHNVENEFETLVETHRLALNPHILPEVEEM